MKLSISLPDESVGILDRLCQTMDTDNRSHGIRHLIAKWDREQRGTLKIAAESKDASYVIRRPGRNAGARKK